MAGEPLELDALSPQELAEVGKQLEAEITDFVQKALTLQQTAGKFAAAGQSVEYLQDQKKGAEQGMAYEHGRRLYGSGGESTASRSGADVWSLAAWRNRVHCGAHHPPHDLHSQPPACMDAGQPLLLPLTESLYVSGTLESVQSVLLEIGTGYFVEVRFLGSVIVSACCPFDLAFAHTSRARRIIYHTCGCCLSV